MAAEADRDDDPEEDEGRVHEGKVARSETQPVEAGENQTAGENVA